jgi:hypothetical protein
MIINTKQDAKIFINRLTLYMVTHGAEMVSKFRIVSISQFGVIWIVKHNNVEKICRTDAEIVDFVYEHRAELNADSELANIDWNELERTVNWLSQIVQGGIIDIMGYINFMEELKDNFDSYRRDLELAYEKTGDKRAKALLESDAWDEDEVCDLLAELEGED